MTETVYTPHQHKARLQGSEHDTLFASIELWLDQLPDVIVLAGRRCVPEDGDGSGTNTEGYGQKEQTW